MVKICVVGDVILDQYDFCSNRHNPESSAPCYTVEKTEFKPGGAGNVAANLVALGAEVTLVSVTGEDHYRDLLEEELKVMGIDVQLIPDATRPTILKQRTLSNSDGRYHFRKDFEKDHEIEDNHTEQLLEAAKNGFDMYIVSDYAKGVVTKRLVQGLIGTGIPVIVDPKPKHSAYYYGAFMVTPNRKEVLEMAPEIDDMKAAKRLLSMLDTNVLFTRSEKGMAYFGKDGKEFSIQATAKEVFDVTGAGDTVVATLAYFLAQGKSIQESAKLANDAAAISVGHIGCYQVTKENLGIDL
jgi:rfaE bifunctional protein kinase chain/domain